jgi:hypothetical protein
MGSHTERTVHIDADPAEVFALLDDQTRLAEHMQRPSVMMGGGRMTYEFDDDRGQAVGSHIKMGGKAFGIPLFVDEVVVERKPPSRKVWRTAALPRLLVIGSYVMGFDISPAAGGSELRVWIDYDLPEGALPRLAGRALAPGYARWCVERMAEDAFRRFAPKPG